MVPSIARQSVILKCLRKKSILLGNYEFYYAAGLLKKLYQFPISEEMEPGELFEAIKPQLDTVVTDNDKEEYLIQLVKGYRVLGDFDGQMKQLFRWGATEENMWSVPTKQKVE